MKPIIGASDMSGQPVRTKVQFMSRDEGMAAELVEITVSPEAAKWIKEEAEHQLNLMLDCTGAAEMGRLGEAVHNTLQRTDDRRFQAIVSELRNALRTIRPREWFRRTDIGIDGRPILRRVRVYRSDYMVDLVQVPLSQDAMHYLCELADKQLRVLETTSGSARLDILAEVLERLLKSESRQSQRVWAREILDALQDTSQDKWLTRIRRQRPDYD